VRRDDDVIEAVHRCMVDHNATRLQYYAVEF
jgi:hypothetical protein